MSEYPWLSAAMAIRDAGIRYRVAIAELASALEAPEGRDIEAVKASAEACRFNLACMLQIMEHACEDGLNEIFGGEKETSE